MPKRYLLYVFIFVLLAVAGMYGYTKWTEAKEKVDLWTLVPEDAVMVVESSDHEEILTKLRRSELWDNISTVRLVESLTENINLLDTLSNRREGASRFLKKKKVLTSLHVISKTDYNFVFYIPVNTVGEHRFVRGLVENINKSQAFTEKSYDYEQFLVTEIKNTYNDETFSFFTFHNNLIVSTNTELLEEIIQKINRGQLTSPATAYQSINYLDQPDVFAHIFINYRYVPGFLNLFFSEELEDDITYLASLCQNSMLGLKNQRNTILMNGFSNPEPLSDSFYNRVKDQKPQLFNLKKFMPAQAALALTFGLDRPAAVKQLRAKDKTLKWAAREIILADSLIKYFRSELAIAYLPAEKSGNPTDKIILALSGNPAGSAGVLQALVNQANATAGQKPFTEQFAGTAIHRMAIPQLPVLLFGSMAGGFAESYVSQVENCVIFGQNAAAVRQVLTAIRDAKVWANNERQKAFLEHTQQEANFSLYLQTDLMWPLIRQQVRTDQQSSLLRHETLLKNLGQLAFQFSKQDDQYYTTLLMRQPLADTTQAPEETYKTLFNADFNLPLISAPYFLNSPAGSGLQVVVQDSSLTLHGLAVNGQRLWSDSLGEALVGPGYSVITGNETKTKFLFATATKIYCLDQNGRDVNNFPFILPDSVQVQRLTLLNPDSPKNYRLLVTDHKGSLFMFDMDGNIQPGWGPKKLSSPLAVAPQHVTVENREVIITLHQNGYIYAFNIKGEPYAGFPITATGTLTGDAFIQTGKSLRATQVTTVTAVGQLFSFNLAGRVLQRKQLPKTSNRSAFKLLTDQENKTYLITRQDAGKFLIFDQNQKLFLQKSFITSSPKLVQYFNFGPLNRIVILTETGPRKSYLFNYKAQLIGEQPINNYLPVALDYNEVSNNYNLYTSQPQTLRKFVFRDK